MPVIKKLSSLISIKRKSPTDRLPTGYVNANAITSAMIRDLAVQTRHLEFILSGGTGVTYSLPARIFGVTTTASAYQFVRFNGTSFVAAQANNATNATVFGVLVPNSNNQAVDVVTQGVVNGFTGLVTGSLYYLSTATAGAITDTVPTTGVLVAVGRALSTTSMIINIDPNVGRVNKLETHVLPSGSMIDYAGATAPSGWMLCDGSEISRATFSDLFAAIGTAYGVGNGSTTFNLPDFRGRFARYNDDMGSPAFRDAVSKTAGSFVVGRKYRITSVGTTSFTSIGASANTVGIVFTATGVGSGTGTADESRVPFTTQAQATAKNGLQNASSTVSTVAAGDHTHVVKSDRDGRYAIRHRNGGSLLGFVMPDYGTNDGTNSFYADTAGSHSHTGTAAAQDITGDTETRPINLACNKIIKLYNY